MSSLCTHILNCVSKYMLMHKVITYGVYGLSYLYSSDLPTSSQATEYKPFHGCFFIMVTDITQFQLVEEHFFLPWKYAGNLLGNECKIRSWQIVWPLASVYKLLEVRLNCIYLVFLLFLIFLWSRSVFPANCLRNFICNLPIILS